LLRVALFVTPFWVPPRELPGFDDLERPVGS